MVVYALFSVCTYVLLSETIVSLLLLLYDGVGVGWCFGDFICLFIEVKTRTHTHTHTETRESILSYREN